MMNTSADTMASPTSARRRGEGFGAAEGGADEAQLTSTVGSSGQSGVGGRSHRPSPSHSVPATTGVPARGQVGGVTGIGVRVGIREA